MGIMMETTKLASAYSRIISGNSNIWEAFPEEKKVCEFSEPLCNSVIKVRNYYIARPYNFLMSLDQWSSITNKIELLTAIRSGMEWNGILIICLKGIYKILHFILICI